MEYYTYIIGSNPRIFPNHLPRKPPRSHLRISDPPSPGLDDSWLKSRAILPHRRPSLDQHQAVDAHLPGNRVLQIRNRTPNPLSLERNALEGEEAPRSIRYRLFKHPGRNSNIHQVSTSPTSFDLVQVQVRVRVRVDMYIPQVKGVHYVNPKLHVPPPPPGIFLELSEQKMQKWMWKEERG